MAEFKLSRLRVTWGGPWTTGTTYTKDTIVQYSGKMYCCLAQHTAGVFLTDLSSAYWGLQIDGKSFLGNWLASTAYVPGNIVEYGGTVYVCTVGHTSSTTLDLTKFVTYVQANAWRQAWTNSYNYGVGDVVKYGGNIYTANTEHTSISATTTSTVTVTGITNNAQTLAITGVSGDGSSVTLSFTGATPFVQGQTIVVSGIVSASGNYNGTFVVSTTSTGFVTFLSNTTGTYTNGGTISYSPTTATVTYTTQSIIPFVIGQIVTIAGVTPSGYNGTYTVQTVSSSQITILNSTVPTWTSGGTVTGTAALGLEANQSSWTLLYSGVNYLTNWASNTRYKINDIVKQGAELFICTTANQDSSFTPSHWTLYMPGSELAGTWSIATTYQQGDIVIYGGYSYISNSSNNVGNNPSTDAVNWSLVTSGFSINGEWNKDTPYIVGSIVTRNGRSYSATANNAGQDPDGSYYLLSYNSTGSSGTTLVVANTNGLAPGMILIGTGISYGQYISKVVDSTTLIISAPPNGTLTNGQLITFVSVNSLYWQLLIPGAMFKGTWSSAGSYVTGDTVVYKNTTYYCVQVNTNQQPDTASNYWVNYIQHFQKNASGSLGDITYYSNTTAPKYTTLSIGTTTYLLKVSVNVPSWQKINVVPNVYYVAPNGQDIAGYGTTWDQPWKTIQYACTTVGAGLAYTTASAHLLTNKEYIVQEMYYWMVAQKAAQNAPFTSASTFDQVKTLRDARYVIDAVAYDLARGGNSQTVATTLMYFVYGSNYAFYNAAVDYQMPLFIAALNQLATTVTTVLNNPLNMVTTYQTLASISSPATYTTRTGYTQESGANTAASTLISILVTALTNQSTSLVPQPNSGLTATIFVKTGTYSEVLPITIPENVALVGDELRGVNVQPTAVINTVATATDSVSSLITAATTINMTDGAPVQFVSSVNAAGVASTLGGLTPGKTYYVVGPSVTSTQFGITNLASSYTGIFSNNNIVTISSASGASWNVTKTATSYTVSICTGGSNYSIGDSVKIPGTSIGGLTPNNDITISVTNVVAGTIVAFSREGSSLSPTTNVTVTDVTATGATFGVVRNGAGFTLTLGSGGVRYTVGDIIKIAGTSIGGTSPQNDITITVATVSSGVIATFTSTGSSLLALTSTTGSNLIYGGGALKNMFYMRNGSGLRNMTLTGLLGTLSAFDAYLIARPTGGSYTSLDPGTGPNDTSAWIFRKSPYVQNVSTFGTGCVGLKIDGTLHAGGNKSIVSNDFTQILSDGVGIWCTGPGALTEAVSVFSYYNYMGYFAEGGGRIRATNGNSSYGTYGVVAQGYDITETPITGVILNRSTQVQASVQSTLSGSATLVKLLYANAGSNYVQPTTNMLQYSNAFTTSPWTNDGYVTLLKNSTALTGLTEAWVVTCTSNSAGVGSFSRSLTTLNPSTGNYTFSIYFKAGTSSKFLFNASWSGYNGSSGNGAGITVNVSTLVATPYGINLGTAGVAPSNYGVQKTLVTGWYRAWFTSSDVDGRNGTCTFSVQPTDGTAGQINAYTIFYGAQMEISPAGYSPSFYLETQNNLYTAFAYYQINGAGTSATVVGDELRAGSIFNARVTVPGTGAGGAGYLTASNFAQTGTSGSVSLALVDTNTASNYLGMRVFITAGTGAGQYGYISAYNSTTKVAQVLQENFDTLTVTTTTATSNVLQLPNGTDFSKVYVNMPVQFIPKYYTNTINATSLAQMSCTASAGGVTNTLTVTSTAGLSINMPIYFIGTPFTAVTTGYQYYVSNIIDSVTIQITANLGQSAVQLTTATGTLTVYYPAYNSYITSSSTTNMTVGLPILFTGTAAGGLATGTTYYINDIIDSTNFTVSVSQINSTSTSASSITNGIDVGNTATLVPLNPVIFTGLTFSGINANSKYYIAKILDSSTIQVATSLTYVSVTATTSGSNLITCSNTTGFIAGNPIKFFGTSFGNLQVETTYYILGAPINGTQFQITGTSAGVTPITLNTSVGAMTGRTATGVVGVTTNTGSMGVLSTGAKSTLQISYNDSLSSTFNTQLFGGVASGTTYYVKTFSSVTNQMTIVTTNGGSTSPTLTTNAGSMALAAVGWEHVNPGTPIVNLDTTSVYYIEPKTTFSDPSFTQTNSTAVQSAGAGNTWKVIGYGLNYFIALPNTGTAAAGSVDGSTWTSLTMPASASWTSITYGNGYWIAVATGTATAYISKNNGASWTSTTLPSSTTWNSIAYGNGTFVITSNGTATAVSTNFGASWSNGTMTSIGAGTVAYGAGKFVYVATAGTNYNTSTDGVTWTPYTSLSASSGTTIAYGNGRFVTVSSAGSNPQYSFDAITWYSANTSVTASFLVYGQGAFLALGTSGTGYISDSGLTWTTKTITNTTYTAAAFGYTSNNDGVFTTLIGQNGGNWITAGIRAKGRAGIISGVMTGINLWESGSGYAGSPTVAFVDPNTTIQAVVVPRVGNGALGNPTFVNRGSGYSTTSTTIKVTGNGYADQYQTGYDIIMNNVTSLPAPGCDLVIAGDPTIYKVTGATAIYGTTAPSIQAVISINPAMTTFLSPVNNAAVSIRTKYSQARLTNHDFLNIGYGNFINSNYPGFPTAGYSAVANSQAVEANFGRVFYTASDQDGNFKVGNLFGVQQSTGIITLSTSQFGLTGLTTLSLGGISVGGSSVTITQFSTDPTFIANSDSVISTQRAIKSYLNNRLSAGSSNTVTTTAQAGNLVFGGSVIAPNVAGTGNKVNVKVNFAGPLAGVDGNLQALEFFARSFNHRSPIF